MKLPEEDRQLLDELCRQNSVNLAKVRKLLETVYNPYPASQRWQLISPKAFQLRETPRQQRV